MYTSRNIRGNLNRPISSSKMRPSAYVQEMATRYGSEELEQVIRQSLSKFHGSFDQELTIDENMNERQNRELVHAIACEMDLRTQSYNDHVRVTKPHNTRSVILLNAQRVKLDRRQNNLMFDHLHDYPIDPSLVENHLKTDLENTDEKRNASYLNHIVSLVPPKAQSSNEMHNFRQRLPASKLRKKILATIDANRVTIITGGTGCGKTTQVPQFLLEDAALCRNQIRIFCTQPRRLPAIAVAERVARERNEPLGDTVGYHIRLEQKTSENTALTYCTSGVLLRMLSMDPLASGITHIILDEVHEREQNTDYLLIILREALKQRSDLKIILMSATIEGNREMFENYFSKFKPCGQCDIPSQLFSVETLYLPEVLALTGYMPSSDFVSWTGNSNSFPQADVFNESQHQYDHLPTVRTVPDLQTYDQQPQVPAIQNGWQQSQNHYAPPSNQYHQHEELTRSNTVPSNLQQYGVQPNYYPNSNYYYNGPPVYVPTTVYSQPMQQQSYMYNNGWDMHSNYYYQNQQYPQSYQQMPMNQQSSSQSTSQVNSGYQKNPGFGSKSSNSPSLKALLNEWLPNRPYDFDPGYLDTLRQSNVDNSLLIKSYQDGGGQQWSDSIDPDLTLAVISYCMDSNVSGSILVFLPGYDDITTLREKVQDLRTQRFKPVVYTLHSQMNSQDQQQVFEEAKPGCRKVILSTNIAEASLTIDDVVFVIDCGKVKEKTYEHNSRISQLKVSWIAKSNAGQRAGRAGRCRNGFCFRLYSKQDYEQMLITQVAEMRRSAIHELCLHAKMFAPNGMPVRRFLDCAPEPPLSEAIDRSLEFLEQLGALYNQEKSLQPPSYFTEQYQKEVQHPEPKMTNLGRIIASLPLEPQLARLLLYGVAMSVLHPIISLVAALAHREPFTLPNGDDKQAALNARDRFAKLDYSDHLMLLRVLNAYSDVHSSQLTGFCRQNFLSKPALIMIGGIRRQLFMELKRLRILPQSARDFDDPEFNHFSKSWPMLQGVIVAGSYPGIAFIRSGSKLRKIHTIIPGSQMASLHPGSSLRRQVNRNRSDNDGSSSDIEPNIECLIYQELSKIDEGLTLRTVSAVTPLAAMLFSGQIRIQKFIIDDFELVEEDYDAHLFPKVEEETEVKAPDFESDDMIPLRYQRDFYVECDQELTFKGNFRELRSVLQLRFKLMTYFMNFLKEPLRAFSDADHKLLQCVTQVLEIEHKNCQFNEVHDTLPKRQVQRQQPRFTNNSRNTTQSNQQSQQQRRLPSPPVNRSNCQRVSAIKYNKRNTPSPEPVVDPILDRTDPLSIQQRPEPQINRIIEDLDRAQDRSSVPNDPAPTIQEPVFDPIPAKAAPSSKQQQRSNRQEPRSKKLIEELDRAQNRTQKRNGEPSQRSEPTASNRNRNEEMQSRRGHGPNNSYRRQNYNQHTDQNEQNYYDKQQPNRFFQCDNDFGNRASGRFNGYNNGRQTQNKNNANSQRHKVDLYVPPPRRNVDDNQQNRQPNDQPKRESFRENTNRRFEDLRLDNNQQNSWSVDRRQPTDNGQRHGESSSFRANRNSGGPKVYSNQSYKRRTNQYPAQ